MNAGVIGFLEAIDRFDCCQPAKLRTYADLRVRGAMLDYLRWSYKGLKVDKVRLSRKERAQKNVEQRLCRLAHPQEIADEMGMMLEDYFKHIDQIRVTEFHVDHNEDDEGVTREDIWYEPSSFEDLHAEHVRELVRGGLDELTHSERTVMVRYYWENLTWLRIAKRMRKKISEVLDLRDSAYLKLQRYAEKLDLRSVY
jgi:RNA polymerase sigma factor for flagellar operon FliA